MKEKIGDQFQSETMYQRGSLSGGGLDWSTKPPVYKRHSSVPTITLPEPSLAQLTAPMGEVIGKRKSVRNFSNQPLSSFELSPILYASQGITPTAPWRHIFDLLQN